MRQKRKDQLNKKLKQVYEKGSGRTEGDIDNYLQEKILGHTYFIHSLGATDEDYEEKEYTYIEFGLYSEGDGCIQTFDMPVSNDVLQQFAARIDMAYYRWMNREPQILKNNPDRLYEYYKDLIFCTVNFPSKILTEEEFDRNNINQKDIIINEAELYAFLPQEED